MNSIDGKVIAALTRLKPIVICGMPRSGTRMMTDVLNRVENVCIQNEMPGPVMSSFFEFVKQVDERYDDFIERNPRRSLVRWKADKAAVSFAFFIFGSKMGIVLEGDNITHIGVKTPGIERFFKEFEHVFAKERPYYLYTLRNPADVWRSVKSMGYYTDVELFKTRYVRSLRNATKIQRHASNRFALFNLDDFKVSQDKGQYIRDKVLSPIGLAERVEDFGGLAQTENRNSLQNAGRSYVADPETQSERESLLADPDIQKYLDMLTDFAEA